MVTFAEGTLQRAQIDSPAYAQAYALEMCFMYYSRNSRNQACMLIINENKLGADTRLPSPLHGLLFAFRGQTGRMR